MVWAIKRAAVLSGLALAPLMGPAAFAAPEDEKPQAQQSQAPDDSQSYLPPWMQKQAGPAASATDKSAEAAALEVPADPAAKQKSGQKAPRRHRDGFSFPFFWR